MLDIGDTGASCKLVSCNRGFADKTGNARRQHNDNNNTINLYSARINSSALRRFTKMYK